MILGNTKPHMLLSPPEAFLIMIGGGGANGTYFQLEITFYQEYQSESGIVEA